MTKIDVTDLTVMELREILKDLPWNYKVNFFGDNDVSLVVEEDSQCVHIDSTFWFEENEDYDED